MIKPMQAIIRMLQGRIILDDGTDVRIVKRDYPIDKTPCITIDDSGGTAIINKHITNKDYPFPFDHPQYKISLQELLADYESVVIFRGGHFFFKPVDEVTYLSDLNNCCMNVQLTQEGAIASIGGFYSSNKRVNVLTREQQEALLGLTVYTTQNGIENLPDKSPTINQQVIREERNITLNLNIWCDDEDQRDEITRKISTLFYQIQSDHYTFCQQYNNGNCTYLNKSCAVDNTTARGIKNQCPKPQEYHYQNLFNAYDIIRASFDVAPAFILDDLTTSTPVLRSIIQVSFSYYEYYNIGGAVSENLHVDEALL